MLSLSLSSLLSSSLLLLLLLLLSLLLSVSLSVSLSLLSLSSGGTDVVLACDLSIWSRSLACSQARPFQQLTVLATYDRCDKQKHSKDGGYDKLCGTPHFARPAEHQYEQSYRGEILCRSWSAEPTC